MNETLIFGFKCLVTFDILFLIMWLFGVFVVSREFKLDIYDYDETYTAMIQMFLIIGIILTIIFPLMYLIWSVLW